MAISNVVKLITLDIYNHDTTPETIKAIAADNDTRYVAAEIQNEGVWYDIGSDSDVELIIIRPDKVGVAITGQPYSIEYTTGGEVDPETGDETPVVTQTYYGVYAELDQPALAKAGTLLGQFKITNGNQILRTEIFKINNGRALDTETDEWAGEYQGYNLEELVARVDQNYSDLEAMINLSNGKFKNVPTNRSGICDGLSVEYKFGKAKLNGTASGAVVLEADSDITAVKTGVPPYRRAINSGMIEDNNIARRIPIEPGTYRVVFNMLSGTVTKSGVTYTSNEDFGSANIVYIFLLRSDATTSGYTIVKTNVTREVDISTTEIGLQVMYCYSGVSFDNAVFELYLEKVA